MKYYVAWPRIPFAAIFIFFQHSGFVQLRRKPRNCIATFNCNDFLVFVRVFSSSRSYKADISRVESKVIYVHQNNQDRKETNYPEVLLNSGTTKFHSKLRRSQEGADFWSNIVYKSVRAYF